MAVTVILADYDSCGDILNEKTLRREQKEATNFPDAYDALVQIRFGFIQYLQQVTSHADKVEMRVGSLRQDKALDLLNEEENQNGSCYTCFADFSAKYGWEFEPFLLADVLNEQGELRDPPLPAGTAMEQGQRTAPDEDKVNLFMAHVSDIADKYPTEDINLLFYDDDPDNKIFKALRRAIEKNIDDFPVNITVKLFRFAWQETYVKWLNREIGETGLLYRTMSSVDCQLNLPSLLTEIKSQINSAYRQVNKHSLTLIRKWNETVNIFFFGKSRRRHLHEERNLLYKVTQHQDAPNSDEKLNELKEVIGKLKAMGSSHHRSHHDTIYVLESLLELLTDDLDIAKAVAAFKEKKAEQEQLPQVYIV